MKAYTATEQYLVVQHRPFVRHDDETLAFRRLQASNGAGEWRVYTGVKGLSRMQATYGLGVTGAAVARLDLWLGAWEGAVQGLFTSCTCDETSPRPWSGRNPTPPRHQGPR
jgi:hypothetical protein